MNDFRQGEALWSEWSGNGLTPIAYKSVVYFTEGHVSLESGIVLGGLASVLQRDGLVDSLGKAKSSIEMASFVSHGFAGEIDSEGELTICDHLGETFYGDVVDEALPVTIVEVVGLGG